MDQDTLRVKLFKLVGFLALFLGAGLFVKKNIEAYQSKLASISYSTKHVDTFKSPTIVFCFNPLAKLSLLQKFNITEEMMILSSDVDNDSPNINLSKPWPDLYHDVSYKMGRDFSLTIFAKDGREQLDINDPDNIEISNICTEFHKK